MMECQLHCLSALGYLWITESTQTELNVFFLSGKRMMCRGSNVKDMMVTSFQLESLILAQNERWRQA